MSKICIKTLYDGEVRRISVEQAKLKVRYLERLVRRQFPALAEQLITLRYKDDEDDLLTVRVDDELKEAVRVARRLNVVLRLLVSGEKRRAAPAAEPAKTESSKAESKADKDSNWRASAPKVAFVTDKSLPDGCVVEPGAKLTKTWTIKNDGDAAWPEDLELVCVGGNMAAKGERLTLPPAKPAEEVDVTVELTAPARGRGKSVWRFGKLTVWAYVNVQGKSSGSDDKKPRRARIPAHAIQRLAKLGPGDFKQTTLQELTAALPRYRFGALCDVSGVRLGGPQNLTFWHGSVQGVGVDLSLDAYKQRFGATAQPPPPPPAAVPQFEAVFVADATLDDGSEVTTGATLEKVWTLKNEGDAAWPEGAVLKCVKAVNMVPTEQSVALPAAAAGEQVEVSVEVVVPAAGHAKSVWRFEDRDGKALCKTKLWTHVVATDAAPEPTASQAKAVFVADKTVLDGSEVAAGASVVKTWVVRNGGSAPWPQGAALVCVGGNLAAEGARVEVPPAAPDAEVEVSVQLTMPKQAAQGKTVWHFEREDGQRFEGDTLWADVVVVEPESKAEDKPEEEDNNNDNNNNNDNMSGDDKKPGFEVAFVADKTLPDDSEVLPGATVTKTWTIRNAGDAAWPHGGVMLACVDGCMGAAQQWQVLPTLAAGKEMDVTVELTVPMAAGRVKSVWVFQNASGERMSDTKLWASVIIAAPEAAADEVQQEEEEQQQQTAVEEVEAEQLEDPMVSEILDVPATPVPDATTESKEESKDGGEDTGKPSVASLVMGALAGGVIGLSHVMRSAAAPPAESDTDGDGEGFQTADEDAAPVVVPADTEEAVEVVDAPAETAESKDAHVEEAPEVVSSSKWAPQLECLAEMGFTVNENGDVITPLLEQHKGNVQAVVLTLLQAMQ